MDSVAAKNHWQLFEKLIENYVEICIFTLLCNVSIDIC